MGKCYRKGIGLNRQKSRGIQLSPRSLRQSSSLDVLTCDFHTGQVHTLIQDTWGLEKLELICSLCCCLLFFHFYFDKNYICAWFKKPIIRVFPSFPNFVLSQRFSVLLCWEGMSKFMLAFNSLYNPQWPLRPSCLCFLNSWLREYVTTPSFVESRFLYLVSRGQINPAALVENLTLKLGGMEETRVTDLQRQALYLPVRRGKLPSKFLAFGLQPLRRRKLAFSKRLQLTAKNSGVSPLWVVCSHVLGLEAGIKSSHHTG